jgi:hypothetical protein
LLFLFKKTFYPQKCCIVSGMNLKNMFENATIISRKGGGVYQKRGRVFLSDFHKNYHVLLLE